MLKNVFAFFMVSKRGIYYNEYINEVKTAGRRGWARIMTNSIMYKPIILAVLAACMISGAAFAGDCKAVSPAFGYNVFIKEDVELARSDTQGRLAAGGNAVFTEYTVGDRVGKGVLENPWTLLAGGDLTFTAPSQFLFVQLGQAGYGGKLNNTNGVSSRGFQRVDVNGIVNIPAEFEKLSALSARLGDLPATGETLYYASQFGPAVPAIECARTRCRIELKGAEAGVNVFAVDGAALSRAAEVHIRMPQDAAALVNISGERVAMMNFAFFPSKGKRAGFNSRRVLFNMPKAQSLLMRGIGVEGSVLAPEAAVSFPGGVFYGNLVARRLGSMSPFASGQFNHEPLEACEILR